jgi:hypothetical protein
MRHSAALQRVELVNVAANERLFIMLGEALAANAALPLTVLDVSHNPYAEVPVGYALFYHTETRPSDAPPLGWHRWDLPCVPLYVSVW